MWAVHKTLTPIVQFTKHYMIHIEQFTIYMIQYEVITKHPVIKCGQYTKHFMIQCVHFTKRSMIQCVQLTKHKTHDTV